MPQPHLPPTPVTSSRIKAQSHPTVETYFGLLPPAMSINPASPVDEMIESTSHSVTSSASSYHPSPPISPHKPPRKRTLSGAAKGKTVDNTQYDLPPPPQRARKIIQMTPKIEPQAQTPTTSPPGSSKGKATKRKQNNSATTAAGRRIARKTAHSIIERRRRSKMNEEFGVLKDMIPACSGQEMHKLAILQAGIEYVRWLEGVVSDLKRDSRGGKRGREEDEDEDFRVGRKASIISDLSPELGPSLSASSSQPQRAQHRSSYESLTTPSTTMPTPNILPTPTLLSPAFGGLHFSPEFTRRSPANNQGRVSATPSPNILPMPPAMMELDSQPTTKADELRQQDREGARTPDQEATATAALMMLTHHDRRNSLSRYKIGRPLMQRPKGVGDQHAVQDEDEKTAGVSVKAMSVRDLLST